MRRITHQIVGAMCVLMTPPLALAQEIFPAHEAQSQSDQGNKGDGQASQDSTLNMPDVVVKGKNSLKEESLIGTYQQPSWTASRRFPTTRVYVTPPGKFSFEWWTEYNVPRNSNKEILYLYELEMGLPHHFQFDLYQGYTNSGDSFNFSQQSLELRWAMADWGKIWANPTWYYEYTLRDHAPNKHEIKLLLGDEISPRWHWGVNLVREWTLTSPSYREEENGITGGVSYTLADNTFSIGAELKVARENYLQADSTKKWVNTVKLGPSLFWKVSKSANIEFAPLIGIGKQSERSQSWLVITWIINDPY